MSSLSNNRVRKKPCIRVKIKKTRISENPKKTDDFVINNKLKGVIIDKPKKRANEIVDNNIVKGGSYFSQATPIRKYAI